MDLGSCPCNTFGPTQTKITDWGCGNQARPGPEVSESNQRQTEGKLYTLSRTYKVGGKGFYSLN